MDFHFHLLLTYVLSVVLGVDFVSMMVPQVFADFFSLKWLGRFRLVGKFMHVFWVWLPFLFISLGVGVGMLVHILVDALSHGDERRVYFFPFKTRGIRMLEKLSVFYWFGDRGYDDGVRVRDE